MAQVPMSGLKAQVSVSDGTAGTPSISFSNDTNTGLYRPGADALGLVTGGVERMRVDNAGNIGIGVTNPQTTLDVGSGSIQAGGVIRAGGATANISNSTFLYHTYLTVQNNVGRNWYVGSEANTGAYVVYNGTYFTGAFISWGGTSWNANSDIRIKKNIEPIENALLSLQSIHPVKYHLKKEADTEKKRLGFIAQDVYAVYPECVNVGSKTEDCPEGTLGICYTELIPVAIQAIKELREENRMLLRKMDRMTQFLQVQFGDAWSEFVEHF